MPTELLEQFQHKLPNKGTWYWDGDTGSRARILTLIQKMMKAKVDHGLIEDVITEMMFVGYVEHERQVKKNTGLSVQEFMQSKLDKLVTQEKEKDELKDTSIYS